MEEKNIHKLTMEDRAKMFLSGVEDVESFDDDKIIAYTTQGILTVEGANLKINSLSVQSGEMEIAGRIDSLFYRDGGKSEGGFFSKIFK